MKVELFVASIVTVLGLGIIHLLYFVFIWKHWVAWVDQRSIIDNMKCGVCNGKNIKAEMSKLNDLTYKLIRTAIWILALGVAIILIFVFSCYEYGEV